MHKLVFPHFYRLFGTYDRFLNLKVHPKPLQELQLSFSSLTIFYLTFDIFY